ncbi:MAG: hypothetical protein EAZ55_11605 [Cytophagales bacterium]|nr:MAG: hypothetical protein EAZ55_11605 [Cytophagales bacterium]
MNRNINVIANNIKDERCILLLGPHFWLDKDGKELHTKLADMVKQQADLQIRYDVDDFLVFKSKSDKTFFYSDLKKFYDQHKEPSPWHTKIAQIPFHAIISGSPDLMLKQAFDATGLRCDFQFYNKKQNSQDLNKPSKDKPLLYNFFGSIQEEDSLILTSDDLFEFLFSVLSGEQQLPRELRSTLKAGKIFLFLGFNFQQWYLKLILRLFELHRDTLPFTEESQMTEELKTFYIDNFEMTFIDLTAKECIDEIYEFFKNENGLKQININKDNPMTAKIKDLIKTGDLENALIELEDFLDGKSDDLLNIVIQKSGEYNRLQRQITKGTIAQSDANLELNKLSDALISIADELKTI